MATILFNAEDIGDAYAPSLNAAFREIYLATGRPPVVKSPLGGRRTLAQAISLGSGKASDHYKGRAVDIDNQRWYRNWNEARFLSILAKYGWRNVQIGGAPFPQEPWHFANQSSAPAGSGATALPGNATTPLTEPIPPTKGKTMTQLVYTNILRPLTQAEEAQLRSYVGGASLNLTVGLGVVALVGDAPGLPANVQVTQSDQRANGWAADHTGSLTLAANGLDVNKAGRPYENDEFFALLAAYAAPLNIR